MILGIIPARYASSRFPGKPLADIAGMSVLERVYRQASKSKSLAKVVVATDDEIIDSHVKKFGGEVIMTSTDHQCGTDRCFEVFQRSGTGYTHVINIQGDEPFINPLQIDALAEMMLKDQEVMLATLVTPITRNEYLFDHSKTKVVLNEKMQALYFSGSPIPCVRGKDPQQWHLLHKYFCHLGLYGYTGDVLARISKLKPSPLEKVESLEQLRWLENGFTIHCGITEEESYSIDIPEDIERLLRLKNLV